jgi:hypothetical protein
MSKGQCYVHNSGPSVANIWVNNNLGQYGEGASDDYGDTSHSMYALYNGGGSNWESHQAQCHSEIGDFMTGDDPGDMNGIYPFNVGWNTQGEEYVTNNNFSGRPGISYT